MFYMPEVHFNDEGIFATQIIFEFKLRTIITTTNNTEWKH